ncbi:hypothetical protein [Streptococcus jiangjianxini]|uniref:hypothetical protein n=1 Tax=Streptococcus jiangjianxini TaxID=3161189 RepID=UPI0032EE1CA8
MKTPHRIILVRADSVPKYNPETDIYSEEIGEKELVPCLVNFISQAKVFELYGSRSEKIMICRFQQEQEPFQSAIYDGIKYEPLDTIDAPIKGAVRLKKVGG